MRGNTYPPPIVTSAMPNRKGSKTKVRHDPRKWTVQALESAPKGGPLSTAQILSKASALSGQKIPYYSIYQALRTLLKRRRVSSARKGRELVYRLTTGPGAAPAAARPRSVRRAAPAPAAVPKPAPATPAPSSPATSLPSLHKIAPGEIALLHVGEAHVETAANIDGKLVLKRHPSPSA